MNILDPEEGSPWCHHVKYEGLSWTWWSGNPGNLDVNTCSNASLIRSGGSMTRWTTRGHQVPPDHRRSRSPRDTCRWPDPAVRWPAGSGRPVYFRVSCSIKGPGGQRGQRWPPRLRNTLTLCRDANTYRGACKRKMCSNAVSMTCQRRRRCPSLIQHWSCKTGWRHL